MEKRGLKYVFISCLLVVVILCNIALVFADTENLYSTLNSYYNSTLGYTNRQPFKSPSDYSSNSSFNNFINYLNNNDIENTGIFYAGGADYNATVFYMLPAGSHITVGTYNSFSDRAYIVDVNSFSSSTHTYINQSFFPNGSNTNYGFYIVYDSANIFLDSNEYNPVTNSLYYTDISNEESYTSSDGVTFYTGGLSLIALAYPDFYSKLQAAAAGSAGLLDWLINDIGAMFMLDPSTNDWYILNAPQNVAYYANDSANTLTLYSGTITEDNTFKRDAGSVSFGSSADYWKHNNAVVKYNYQTQEFEYSNTFNGLTINRGANGVWINRGSSMLALDDPINEQREGLLHGRYVINNPSIGDNFDQYLDNSGDDTSVIDGDLFALLNEIKNWSQVDALTQKYLLNTLNEISSFTSEVIDYLGPNYLYPTITSYFDSLFRLNGLRYSAYDQNNNKVEYNLHNKSIGDVLTEEYLMLTSIGSDNRPAQYYQYDGDVKVNPLYSLWNDIKNLPDNIATKIQPIFPTIPGSNDTIIDSVGDYNNRVSLNPQNVTDTHENLTDLLSWFHLEGFSGSFSDIFGSSDRWSLWSEETYTNCGLEVDTEE